MLRLRLIQAAEVLEHHAALLGCQSGQLFPRRIAHFRARARGSRTQRGGNVDAVAEGGLADALLLIVGLLALKAPARIEQLAVQTLLPLNRAAIQSTCLELTGEIARLLRQLARGTSIALGLQALELLSE